MGRVLALDYGKKRIGFATGDLEMGIAFPGGVILNTGVDASVNAVCSKFDEVGAEFVIVGLPLNMDFEDQENAMMTEVRFFVKKLREKLGSEMVKMIDERLSSYEAHQLMHEIIDKTGGTVKLPKDAYAAQVILQRFFETDAKK